MTTQRVLSPFEISYFARDTHLGGIPIGGMPLFIGSTVRGPIDPAVLGRVLTELAANHALLRASVVTDPAGAQRFVLTDGYQPALEVIDAAAGHYRKLVNSPREWHTGLFHAQLLREPDRTRIVLILHHGIADGRSAFALLTELWRRYTAHLAGSPLPLSNSDHTLIPGVDTQLAALFGDETVEAFLARVRTTAAGMDPAAAPRTLPRDGDGVGDPSERLAMRRIELTAEHTTAVIATARAQGLSVNSLLSGAAMAAARAEFPEPGPLPLLCGHAADLRSELSPPVPDSVILNCASGTGTPVVAEPGADPIALATMVAAGMAATLDTHFPALFMRASQTDLDPMTAALFAAPPTLALSNIGRIPVHALPEDLQFIRDDVFAMAAGMPPKMTIFTVGNRLTIQVEYDTADHSHAQMGRIASAMDALVHQVCSSARQ
ncbi:phthiocerol/phthiodiolone dimycocerosyl transferase family protein [Nocardia sp. IFM 10818]